MVTEKNPVVSNRLQIKRHNGNEALSNAKETEWGPQCHQWRGSPKGTPGFPLMQTVVSGCYL